MERSKALAIVRREIRSLAAAAAQQCVRDSEERRGRRGRRAESLVLFDALAHQLAEPGLAAVDAIERGFAEQVEHIKTPGGQ